MSVSKIITALVAFSGLATQVAAAPVQWTLSDWTIEFYETTGSFVFDADTSVFSDINVSHSLVDPNTGDRTLTFQADTIETTTLAGQDVMVLFGPSQFFGLGVSVQVLAPLTNAGGIVDVSSDNLPPNIQLGFGDCSVGMCFSVNDDLDFEEDAMPQLIGVPVSPVPLPAGLPLLLIGLGAFGVVRHTRQG